MPRRTASTITDADAFIDHLREVAAQGYAVDREEFADGVSCVSAPIFDRSDFPIGAYTLSLPSGRFAKRLPQLIEAVKRAGINASVALGYMGPYPPASPLLND
jgi:DNA-binding IclR family transcriptional regulator